jgi:hypothetical protein
MKTTKKRLSRVIRVKKNWEKLLNRALRPVNNL